MGKLPAILLYDGDWLKDAVSGCSLAAQGLWLRMMFIGHNSERYGYLAVNGLPIPPESIARRCGCTLEQYLTLLAELDAAKVPSRTPDGIIFSRRMVRDAADRVAAAQRQERCRQKKKDCHASVTPMSPIEDVNEKEVVIPVSEKPIQLVRFEVEDFDAEQAFEVLCAVYSRAERSHSAETYFLQGIEWLVEKRGMKRHQAAEFICRQAALYCERESFHKGMTNWLRDKVFAQDASAWGKSRSSGGSLDGIYGGNK